MNTGEGVGVLLRTKTLVKYQRERVSPRHGIRESEEPGLEASFL